MGTLKIAVCDDQLEIVHDIKEKILANQNIGYVKKQVDIFTDAESLWAQYEFGAYYHIVFLDIEMSGMSGIEVAKKIREVDLEVLLIFISGYDKYLLELFEIEPFRFIKKPISEIDFNEVMAKAYKRITTQSLYFEYKSNRDYIRVPLAEILYFESRGRIILIHKVKDEETFYGKLDEVDLTLYGGKIPFLRVHQSYLVNYQAIRKFGYSRVILVDNTELQISEDRQKKVRGQFVEYWRVLNDI